MKAIANAIGLSVLAIGLLVPHDARATDQRNADRDTEDSLLFTGFVDVVENDYRALQFKGPLFPAALDASFQEVRASAVTLNDNFELFDGDEVVLLIEDLNHFDATLEAFKRTLQSGQLTSPGQMAELERVVGLLIEKQAHVGSTVAVAQEIKRRFNLVRIDLEEYSAGADNRIVGDISRYMDELFLLIDEAEAIFGATETRDVIDAIVAEAAEGIHVLGMVEHARETMDRSFGQAFHLNTLSALRGGTFRPPAARNLAAAGPSISGLQLAGDYWYTTFTDTQYDWNGRNKGGTIAVSGVAAQRLDIGVSSSRSSYTILPPVDIVRESEDHDAYVMWSLTPALSLGAFLGYSQIDIGERTFIVLGQPIQVGDSYHRWQVGALADLRVERETYGWGVTTSLASGNKRSLSRVLDDEDSSWATLVDVHKSWGDHLATSLHATYFAMLDNEQDADGFFWIVGADAEVALNDRISVSIGYEKTLGRRGYRDDTVNLGLVLSW